MVCDKNICLLNARHIKSNEEKLKFTSLIGEIILLPQILFRIQTEMKLSTWSSKNQNKSAVRFYYKMSTLMDVNKNRQMVELSMSTEKLKCLGFPGTMTFLYPLLTQNKTSYFVT